MRWRSEGDEGRDENSAKGRRRGDAGEGESSGAGDGRRGREGRRAGCEKGSEKESRRGTDTPVRERGRKSANKMKIGGHDGGIKGW